ncbi:MAG: substrate-binding domain-containing protein [Lachnospiraceae bacterium]
MMKKKKLIVSILLCAVLFLCACSKEVKNEEKPEGSGEPIKEKEYQSKLDILNPQAYGQVSGLNLQPKTYISIIGRGVETPYWKEVKKGVDQAAADINTMLGYKGEDKVKVNYSAPSKNNNVDEQINILDEELARYPSAVGIAIIDSKACSVQFDLAAENGIPIVAFDSGSDYQGIVCMLGTNNQEISQMTATKLCSSIGDEGEIFLVVHDSKSTTGMEREKAAVEEITVNHPQVTIAETIHLDDMKEMAKIIAGEKNANLSEGQAFIDPEMMKEEDILQYYFEKHPNIKGAIGTNEDAVHSIIIAKNKVLKNSENFLTVGVDGGEPQMEELKSGEINGLIVQNPFGMGYATVVAAARSVLEQGNEAVVDSGYIWITKDNLKEPSIKKMLY